MIADSPKFRPSLRLAGRRRRPISLPMVQSLQATLITSMCRQRRPIPFGSLGKMARKAESAQQFGELQRQPHRIFAERRKSPSLQATQRNWDATMPVH